MCFVCVYVYICGMCGICVYICVAWDIVCGECVCVWVHMYVYVKCGGSVCMYVVSMCGQLCVVCVHGESMWCVYVVSRVWNRQSS